MKRRFLTAKQVLLRMRKGDLPVCRGMGTGMLFLSDGMTALPEVVHQLIRQGDIDYPVTTSCDSPYRLLEPGKEGKL